MCKAVFRGKKRKEEERKKKERNVKRVIKIIFYLSIKIEIYLSRGRICYPYVYEVGSSKKNLSYELEEFGYKEKKVGEPRDNNRLNS